MAGPGIVWLTRDWVDHVARQSPARLAVGVFAGVIAVFTALLSIPAATSAGTRASFADALFTATSAVSVTGLTTVNTGDYWSTLGHVIILAAIKVGGLGVMTLASLLGFAVSRHLGLTQKLLTASETKASRFGEVGSLIRTVIITSTLIELAVFALLIPRFIKIGETVGEASWHAMFYAISAFNNAGFSPTTAGLAPHTGDWMILLPIMVGVFIGSLGFPVILNLARTWRAPRRWRLHTKLTLLTSAVLLVLGAVVIAVLEWRRGLAHLNWSDTILNSLFYSVMTRSGGFATVPVSELEESTHVVFDALMFVGGGSASTSGGIKVTTLAVMFIALVAEARGDFDMNSFRRRIPRHILKVGVSVTMVAATTVLVGTVALMEVTGAQLGPALFEVISAFGTCGLTLGLTENLPDSGKYILTIMMFIGRTGTMTLAAALALRSRRRVIRFPEERLNIG